MVRHRYVVGQDLGTLLINGIIDSHTNVYSQIGLSVLPMTRVGEMFIQMSPHDQNMRVILEADLGC